MTYTKPKVNTLGDAASIIENIPVRGKNSMAQHDGTLGMKFHDPAYDLDD